MELAFLEESNQIEYCRDALNWAVANGLGGVCVDSSERAQRRQISLVCAMLIQYLALL